jgi:hypothetical protein
MADQIIDKRTVAIPGPVGQVSPSLQQLHDETMGYRDQAQTYAAGTQVLQDSAVAALVRGSGALTRSALLGMLRADVFDPRDFGARVDGVLTTASADASSGHIQLPGVSLSASDVGKRMAVAGAGRLDRGDGHSQYGNDGVLIGTISSVVSEHVCVLDNPVVSDVQDAKAVYGTSDSPALQSAFDACRAHGGGTVVIPSGIMIVDRQLHVFGGLTVQGANSWASSVYPVMEMPGTYDIASNAWLYVLEGEDIGSFWCRDFHLDAFAMGIAPGGAGTSSVKPLQIHNVINGGIQHCYVENTPSTAIPFDNGRGTSLIEGNLVVNPGRLAKPNGQSAGCAGIGVGTPVTPYDDAGNRFTSTIRDNAIYGAWSDKKNIFGDDYAGANYGIFVENQKTTGTPDAMSAGVTIAGNTVWHCRRGIGLGGGLGPRVTGNEVISCGALIALDNGSYFPGAPSLLALIEGNNLRNAIDPANDGTMGDGVLIEYLAGRTNYPNLYAAIRGNVINTCAHAITVRMMDTTTMIRGISIQGNTLTDCSTNLYVTGKDSSAYVNGAAVSNIIFSNNMLGKLNGLNNIVLSTKVARIVIVGNCWSTSDYIRTSETLATANQPDKLIVLGNDDDNGFKKLKP